MKKLILLCAVFSTFFLSQCISTFSCKKWLEDTIASKNIKAVIVSKTTKGNSTGIIITDKKDTLSFCTLSKFRNFWENIKTGDSISKPKNTLVISIFNSERKEESNYPCCDW